MAAINGCVQIEPVVEPGRVQSASSSINIDMTTRIEIGPRMRIVTHHTNRKVIQDAVVDAEAYSAGRKVVSLCIRVRIHSDKIAESRHPDAPTILRSRLEYWFDDALRKFSVHGRLVFQIHGGSVDFYV